MKKTNWEEIFSSQEEFYSFTKYNPYLTEEPWYTPIVDFFKYDIPFAWYEVMYQIKSNRQLLDRGYTDSDVWGYSIANARRQVLILTQFKDNKAGYPDGMTEKKWNKILDEIIDGFQSVIDRDEYLFTSKDYKKELRYFDKRWKKGMALYVEYYFNLWD